MLSYFKLRAARRKAETELAEMRIVLDAIIKLFGQGETPQENAVYIAKVGNQIRIVLEHRFGWARETFIGSDENLRSEEKLIDSLPDTELEKLVQKVSGEADKRGKAEEVEKTIALRILEGWLACKLMARNSADKNIVRQALDHEELHLDHIRNSMRILRGEKPVA